MNRSVHPLIWKPLAASLAAATLYLLLYPLHLLEIPKLRTGDFLISVRRHLSFHRPPALNDLLLVYVDDESIERLKQKWPFERRVYADFLNKVAPAKPRAVAFDFVFSGRGNPADDFLLASAIEQAGHVVLASFIDQEGRYFLPHRELRAAAHGVGFVNKLFDRDLRVRRSHLVYRDQSSGQSIGRPWEVEILAALRGPGEGAISIPFDERRGIRINYRFTFKDVDRISFWQALQTEELKQRARGKTVLVGAVSHILHDRYDTPLGLMPGIVLNMNLLSNLMQDDYLKSLPFAFDLFFLILFAGTACYVSMRYHVAHGLLAMGALSGGFAVLSFLLAINNYVGDAFTPLAGGWFLFLAGALYRYFHTFVENVSLRAKVITDPLTGLHNRRALEAKLDHELAQLTGTRGGRRTDPFLELSVLMIDVDNFKRINDTFGHPFGDDVLKKVGFAIKENTRKDDFAARYGGEEFCVVLPHTTKDQARQIGEKICLGVASQKLTYVDRVTTVTVSIGSASAMADGLAASRALIRAADAALYEAKRSGKNRVILHHR